MIDNALRQELLQKCAKLQAEKKKEISILENISVSIYENDEARAVQQTAEFSSVSERTYIDGKEISLLASGYRKDEVPNYSYAGTTVLDEAGIEKKSYGWVITTPPLYNKKSSERMPSDGKYIHYLILKQLENFEKKNGFMEEIINPVVVFEHHIELNNLSKLFDADNIDTKAALDAINGFLFCDDNIINLSTIHTGVKDHKSYCKIHVFEKKEVLNWISDNIELFNE